MKRFFLLSMTLLFLGILVVLGAWYIAPSLGQKYHILSPLPDFLTITKNSQASTLELFLPHLTTFFESDDTPQVTATSVLMYDLTTDKALFAIEPKRRLPMASLTKIMTAIIAIENPKDDDRYLVPKEALVGENSMGLTAGENLTLTELLYGMMLPSGNDASEVLAYNYVDGRDAFVRAMNNKAKALGLVNTQFTNPSGLQGDGDQYTTAADLLVITKYALRYPLFRDVVATVEHAIPETTTHSSYMLYNETNLLTTYPGVKGVKTGYTPEAAYCLVTYLDYEGHEIVGILLGSQNRREEMKELLDFSLTALTISPPAHQ